MKPIDAIDEQHIDSNRPQYVERQNKIILQHDNAQSHVAVVVKTYLNTLKCEVLPYPPTVQTFSRPLTFFSD